MHRYHHGTKEASPVRKTLVPLLLFIACVVASAEAQHSSASKSINGSGCVEKSTENSCRVVIDTKTGDLYNLLSVPRRPSPARRSNSPELHNTTRPYACWVNR